MQTQTVKVKSVHKWGYVLFGISGSRIDLPYEYADYLAEKSRIPKRKFRKNDMFVIIGDDL